MFDVAIFVPGKHQRDLGDGRRDTIEREDVAMVEPLHQDRCRKKFLPHLSAQRQVSPLLTIV